MYIVYELNTCSRDLSTDFTLWDCLFRAVQLTENTGKDKYRYSSYGIGFDAGSLFCQILIRVKMLQTIVLQCMSTIEKKTAQFF